MRLKMAILCCLSLHAAARAQVVVDTFGPGGSFSTTWVYNYGGGQTAPSHLGFGFNAQASGPLTDITAPIFRSGLGSLMFELYADSPAVPGTPGALLFSTVFPAPAIGAPLVAPTLTLAAGPEVNAGANYYAVFTPQSARAQVRWFLGGDPAGAPIGPEVYRFPGGQWITEPQAYAAFRLSVPSPGVSAPLIAAGGWAGCRRRRASNRS